MDTLISGERLADDIPLCNIADIVASVEDEIYAGYIRKIYDIVLGYIVYDNQDAKKPKGQINEDYYIVPAWMVNCIYIENPQKEHIYSKDEFEMNTKEITSLIINVQTAEMINRKYNKKDKADYIGFLSWDDIGR